MNKNKVSVIMPNYNQHRYIPLAIESLVKQSHLNWELIIIDDASTDSSVVEIERLMKYYKDRDIKLIQNRKNRGPAYSRNLGIQVASGEYIALLDADDYYKPDKLKVQLNYLITEEFDLVYTDVEVLDMNTKNKIYVESYYESDQNNLLAKTLERQVITAPATLMVRKECLKNIMYDEQMFHAEDYKFTLELFQKCRVGYQNCANYIWRRHDDNISNERSEQSTAEQEVVKSIGISKIMKIIENTSYSESEKKILLLKILIKIEAWEEINKIKTNSELNMNTEFNFYMATYHYKNKRYALALDSLLRIENPQELPEVYNNIGCCYANLKKLDNARVYFCRASEKNKNYLDAKLNSKSDIDFKYTERMLRKQLVPYSC